MFYLQFDRKAVVVIFMYSYKMHDVESPTGTGKTNFKRYYEYIV